MKNQRRSTQFYVSFFVTGLVLSSALMACSGTPTHEGQSKGRTQSALASSGDAPKTPEANLTQREAEARKSTLSDVAYKLTIKMDETSETFFGQEQIHFVFKRPTQGDGSTFLDLDAGAKIQTLSVNGQSVATPAFANHRLNLPANLLKDGANEVDLVYAQNYSHDGRGLHRFVDPEDKKVYLYSQFESFDAHQMFACFDQPDLKATMSLTAVAPNAWQVISTTRETLKKKSADGTVWSFPETPRLSTYLFSLHAGPYHKWESKAGKIPLRLFSRESLARYVIVKDWFTPTQQGLKFYGDYFAYAYPFKKYDQIIAPDFNAGAMENVAAITFAERFVHRGAISRKDREHLASTILHEMAHMWFGDLVTMQWWDNLWLNESFATFMSTLAMEKATEFKEAWSDFYSHDKSWAYFEDQLVTTHPINGDVPDTESTFVNFDGITYGKGASVLKQLRFYLGDTNFRDGVRGYFKAHAFGNAMLKDFMGALEVSSKKDLGDWSKTWLQQAGLDALTPDYDCNGGKITRFELKLHGPDGQESPRAHSTAVTLYKDSGSKLDSFKTVEVEYKSLITPVQELVGQTCPSLVNPNDRDEDYVKSELDARSLQAAKTQLNKINSPFVRLVLWSNLFQMVRDAKLPAATYTEILLKNYPGEKDLDTAEQAVHDFEEILHFLPDYGSQHANALASQVDEMIWQRLISSEKGSDWQKSLFKTFAETTQSRFGQDRLFDLLTSKTKLKGLELDTDRRWSLIHRLSSLGDERAKALIAQERKADSSERGIESALASESAWPTLEIKKKYFDEAVQKSDLKYARQRAMLLDILPFWQDGLRGDLGGNYFDSLPKLAQTRQEEFLGLFSSSFLPATCTDDSVKKISSFIAAQGSQMPSNVKKNLLIGRQEDERCVRVRAAANKLK